MLRKWSFCKLNWLLMWYHQAWSIWGRQLQSRRNRRTLNTLYSCWITVYFRVIFVFKRFNPIFSRIRSLLSNSLQETWSEDPLALKEDEFQALDTIRRFQYEYIQCKSNNVHYCLDANTFLKNIRIALLQSTITRKYLDWLNIGHERLLNRKESWLWHIEASSQ